MKKKRLKSKDMLRHVKRKFWLRWNIDLTDELHRRFVEMIKNREGELIEKQSNRVWVWKIKYKEKAMTVVYDKTRNSLITVLPENVDIKDRFIYDNKYVV